MERFKKILPDIAKIEPLGSDDEIICYEAFDASGKLIGYAFASEVPESMPDIPGMEEMDKYNVVGAVDPADYKIIGLDISLHPEGPEEPWDARITEDEFGGQFVGLTVDEIELAPDGKIDAISDATFSSSWLTEAIREKVSEIIKKTKK